MQRSVILCTRALISSCKRRKDSALPPLIAGYPRDISPCPSSNAVGSLCTFSSSRIGGRNHSPGSGKSKKNRNSPSKSRGKNNKSITPLKFEAGTKFDDAIQIRVDNLGIIFGKAMEQIEIASEAPEKRTPILNSKKFYYNQEAEAAVLAAAEAIDEYESIMASLKGRAKKDFEKYNDNNLMIEQLKLEIRTFVLDE